MSKWEESGSTWTGSTSARLVLYTSGRGIRIGHKGLGDWGNGVEAKIIAPRCKITEEGEIWYMEAWNC